MKKTQRLLCLLTTLILLLAQLPALADGYVPLTQQEIAQARQLIAMEGDIQGWEKGMTPLRVHERPANSAISGMAAFR